METLRQVVVENHLDNKDAKWFAVYTRYKREKVVERLLKEKGIEVYLPIQKQTRRYTRKVRIVELPLLSCYIFVKIVKAEYVSVLETENVVRFIHFSKNLLSIPEKEINLMQRIVGEVDELTVLDRIYTEGDIIEVVAGNLTGLRGKLISRQGKKCFLVELSTVGYSLQINIEPHLLRKV